MKAIMLNKNTELEHAALGLIERMAFIEATPEYKAVVWRDLNWESEYQRLKAALEAPRPPRIIQITAQSTFQISALMDDGSVYVIDLKTGSMDLVGERQEAARKKRLVARYNARPKPL
jgi:hypothetical protein